MLCEWYLYQQVDWVERIFLKQRPSQELVEDMQHFNMICDLRTLPTLQFMEVVWRTVWNQ